MIQLSQIKKYFPQPLRDNAIYHKYILKEYLQLMILDYLSSTAYIKKVSFIGGTCLRLVKGIDRFSEDIDFDCKNLGKEEFIEMTDLIIRFLQQAGWQVEVKDKNNPKLSAFRRNIHFPGLLFDLGISGHKEERFLIKIESQDQGISYPVEMVDVVGCGYFFPFPVPPDAILCSMKVAAMLNRSKGRDFYDLMFLLTFTGPDYGFLGKCCGINSMQELKSAIRKRLASIDLKNKQRDFEHLLFNKQNSKKIIRFPSFINTLK